MKGRAVESEATSGVRNGIWRNKKVRWGGKHGVEGQTGAREESREIKDGSYATVWESGCEGFMYTPMALVETSEYFYWRTALQ